MKNVRAMIKKIIVESFFQYPTHKFVSDYMGMCGKKYINFDRILRLKIITFEVRRKSFFLTLLDMANKL